MTSEAVAASLSNAKGRIAPFGKYLLLQRVSVGGMAEVFKAIPEGASRIDQIVAIKRILPNIAEDSEFIGMFIDEARIAGQLTHPNICRIYELGRVGPDHYIAMQFLWGRDLLKVMNRLKKSNEVIPPPMAAFIAARACAALHYAHTKRDALGRPLNIIHRDVSPQNIIVGYSGQVKLIDFGVARAASQSQKTQAGILKGKFGYMSPEMIRSLPVDHRSDVFAMGICLHEALTGSRLFYGETDFATLEQVRDARVMPPSAKVPGIPPALDAIVLKALAREAEDRFSTAQEMEQALDEFLAALYPGYGEADVGMVMRHAFAQEVAREKQRLEVFSDMLRRGELVRGASVPALPSEPPPSGERSAVSPEGSPRPAAPAAPAFREQSEVQPPEPEPFGAEADVADEQTQIFFSATELEEIRELEHEPRFFGEAAGFAPDRQPAVSDVIMGGPSLPSGSPSTRPTRPSGTYERPAPNIFGVRTDERRVPTMTIKTVGDDATWVDDDKKQARRKTMRLALLAALSALLLVGGYSVTRLFAPRGATLEIVDLGDADALVRVDGVLRGNAPLSVSGLEPGIHEIEIETSGYEPVRMSVHVAAGEVRPVRPVLQRKDASASAAAHAGGVAPAPTTIALPPTAPAPKEEEATERPRPRTPRAAPRTPAVEATEASGAEAPSTADEAAPPPGETDIAETINEETLADNEGELLLSTLPWSRVFIDGVDTGRDTPVRSLRVPAGPHTIGLRTPDGVMHDVEVVVEPGKVVRIIRRF